MEHLCEGCRNCIGSHTGLGFRLLGVSKRDCDAVIIGPVCHL